VWKEEKRDIQRYVERGTKRDKCSGQKEKGRRRNERIGRGRAEIEREREREKEREREGEREKTLGHSLI
jgi:hypothetical protein